jgi:hypothetical protein
MKYFAIHSLKQAFLYRYTKLYIVHNVHTSQYSQLSLLILTLAHLAIAVDPNSYSSRGSVVTVLSLKNINTVLLKKGTKLLPPFVIVSKLITTGNFAIKTAITF